MRSFHYFAHIIAFQQLFKNVVSLVLLTPLIPYCFFNICPQLMNSVVRLRNCQHLRNTNC